MPAEVSKITQIPELFMGIAPCYILYFSNTNKKEHCFYQIIFISFFQLLKFSTPGFFPSRLNCPKGQWHVCDFSLDREGLSQELGGCGSASSISCLPWTSSSSSWVHYHWYWFKKKLLVLFLFKVRNFLMIL